MKKCINGKIFEMTPEEVDQIQSKIKEQIYQDQIRPRTIEEGMLELNRALLIDKVSVTEDKTLAIACMALFEQWTPGKYNVGDIRTDPTTGYPRECILDHDSSVNSTWDIMTPTLWKPYHSCKKEYALPWEAPTGAHDIYKAGEYMIWTDHNIYKCELDTNYSPADYILAWKKED